MFNNLLNTMLEVLAMLVMLVLCHISLYPQIVEEAQQVEKSHDRNITVGDLVTLLCVCWMLKSITMLGFFF